MSRGGFSRGYAAARDHWDIDDGRGNRNRFNPDGTPTNHNNWTCDGTCKKWVVVVTLAGAVIIMCATGVPVPVFP